MRRCSGVYSSSAAGSLGRKFGAGVKCFLRQFNMYGISVHTGYLKGWHATCLRQLHGDASAKGVPSYAADKLAKLLFALETADGLEQVSRPAQGRHERILELDRDRQLARDFSITRGDEHRQRY